MHGDGPGHGCWESTVLTGVHRHSQTRPPHTHTHTMPFTSAGSSHGQQAQRKDAVCWMEGFPDHASGTLEVSINEQLLALARLFSDVIKYGFLHVVSDKW